MCEISTMTSEIAMKMVDEVIIKNFNVVLSQIYKKGSKVMAEYSITSGTGLTSYYHSVLDKYLYSKTILDSKTKIPLYDMYVPVDLEQNKKTIETQSVKNLFEKNKHFIISGLAGAGKTTLTKYLFIESIRLGIKVPILIELRNLKYSDNILNSISAYLSTFNFIIAEEVLDNLLQKGAFTIFFDGLDEMPIVQQKEFSAELHKFRDKYHSNYLVIISRPFDLLKSYEAFEIFQIKKLTLEQAALLIDKLNYDIDIKSKFISVLKSKLFVRHKSFAQNPLLLTIMLMTYDQNADIPDQLHEFYQMAYEALYQRHDATKGGSYHRDMHCRLNMIEFEKVLSCFCYYTLFQGQISLGYEQLIDNIAKTKTFFNTFDFKDEQFANDLIQCVCLVAQEGFNYQFVHRSFQEYFCAKFIANILSEEKVAKVLQRFSMKMDLRDTFNLLNEIKPIYIEKYYFLPVIESIEEQVFRLQSISKFISTKLITSIGFSYDKEITKIIWFGTTDNRDHYYLNDIMYMSKYYNPKFDLLAIHNMDGFKKYVKYMKKLSDSTEYILNCSDDIFEDILTNHLQILKEFLEKEIIVIKTKINEKVKKQNDFIDELLN